MFISSGAYNQIGFRDSAPYSPRRISCLRSVTLVCSLEKFLFRDGFGLGFDFGSGFGFGDTLWLCLLVDCLYQRPLTLHVDGRQWFFLSSGIYCFHIFNNWCSKASLRKWRATSETKSGRGSCATSSASRGTSATLVTTGACLTLWHVMAI